MRSQLNEWKYTHTQKGILHWIGWKSFGSIPPLNGQKRNHFTLFSLFSFTLFYFKYFTSFYFYFNLLFIYPMVEIYCAGAIKLNIFFLSSMVHIESFERFKTHTDSFSFFFVKWTTQNSLFRRFFLWMESSTHKN